MNEEFAREIVGRLGIVPDRIIWDARSDDGDFPLNYDVDWGEMDAIATDDVGNVVQIERWVNTMPEAPGASWVFYFSVPGG